MTELNMFQLCLLKMKDSLSHCIHVLLGNHGKSVIGLKKKKESQLKANTLWTLINLSFF